MDARADQRPTIYFFSPNEIVFVKRELQRTKKEGRNKYFI